MHSTRHTGLPARSPDWKVLHGQRKERRKCSVLPIDGQRSYIGLRGGDIGAVGKWVGRSCVARMDMSSRPRYVQAVSTQLVRGRLGSA